MTPGLLVAVMAGAFAAVFILGLATRPPDPIARLGAEYRALMRMGRAEAAAHVAERVASLRERMPGHDNQWYLQWLVDDLRRAKR